MKGFFRESSTMLSGIGLPRKIATAFFSGSFAMNLFRYHIINPMSSIRSASSRQVSNVLQTDKPCSSNLKAPGVATKGPPFRSASVCFPWVTPPKITVIRNPVICHSWITSHYLEWASSRWGSRWGYDFPSIWIFDRSRYSPLWIGIWKSEVLLFRFGHF